jgi:glycosyltransferase involved in cell wall biosynthesis
VRNTVRVLGTHGVPGNYGGFETAAENVSKYLVRKGWRVVVYCQGAGTGPITEDLWEGIERVHIPVDLPGWRGTSKFDWLSIAHACKFDDLCLTFGYNTGIYNFRQRLKGIRNVINMDGIEWRRSRWGLAKQAVLYANERFAALFGDHLIADHPEIEKYLLTRAPKRKLSTITYGADPVTSVPSTESLASYGLEAGKYLTLIARPIPENSILDIVRGFSAQKRGYKLALLGKYEPEKDPFHAAVVGAASNEVQFLGPVYGEKIIPIRYHGVAYLHGHTVGGTNPSLVEALAAGNPVIAHDNPYNRWVARDAAVYFGDADSFSAQLTGLLADQARLQAMHGAALQRFEAEFTWDRVAGHYEQLLRRYLKNDQMTARTQQTVETQ